MWVASSRKLLFLILASASLSACGNSSSDPGTPAGGLKGTYNFEQNGCKTGDQNYSSLEDLCTKLVDEDLNRHCAQDLRKIEFQNRCKDRAWPGEPVPKPKPGPVPTNDCYSAATFAPKGPEVALESLVDGMGGYYRLTSMNNWMKYKEGDRAISWSAYAVAGTDTNLNLPEVSTTLTCKNFEEAPYGNSDGKFRQPLVIQRESGKLKGTLYTSFDVNGPKTGDKDRISAEAFPQFNLNTLFQLRQESLNSGTTIRVYQIGPKMYQMLAIGKQSQGSKSYEIVTSAIYILEAPIVKPAPQPGPAPAPVPTPAPLPDNSADAIAEVCNEHLYVKDKVDCLQRMQGKAILLPVLEICKQHLYTRDKVTCMESLAGVNIPENVIKVCDQHLYVRDKVTCLLKFKK